MEPTRGRGTPKEPLILDAARTVFLRRGFGPAGVDEIAALAAISKVTLYKYFPSKEQLFAAVIRRDIEAAERRSEVHLDALTSDLPGDLRAFAREFVTTVTGSDLLRMRRLVATEAERFPDLARTWDERSRLRGLRTLRQLFGALAGRGLLAGDMDVAAEQFLWLLLGAPFNESLFTPAGTPTPRDLTAHADAAVATFLAAFAPPPTRPTSTPTSPPATPPAPPR
ncbi:TetR/AcrR family transcriptional regulator [Jiangella mangrovi]|uniref:AcrR family transcriptional regulator n=1 Tax=Jiangella mangrovi TaxID=1524084 RepID=A0A7W9GU37_9ACTN|nr:TetR/AcrR family transcriptional regulator [Jiangella mangrovi]MBB5790095.1 AcrR family transcriptional regulator [Jiangella mangrovi]